MFLPKFNCFPISGYWVLKFHLNLLLTKVYLSFLQTAYTVFISFLSLYNFLYVHDKSVISPHYPSLSETSFLGWKNRSVFTSLRCGWVKTRLVHRGMQDTQGFRENLTQTTGKEPALRAWGHSLDPKVLTYDIWDGGPEAHGPGSLISTAVNKRFCLKMKSKDQHPRLSSDLRIKTRQAQTCTHRQT